MMMLPSFLNLLPWNPIPLPWIERGGGELGEAWHQAAMKTHKINSIFDFICCAEFLIHDRYTSSERLAIEGGSAGGILVGGALTKPPDLFRAVLFPPVRAMDRSYLRDFGRIRATWV